MMRFFFSFFWETLWNIVKLYRITLGVALGFRIKLKTSLNQRD